MRNTVRRRAVLVALTLTLLNGLSGSGRLGRTEGAGEDAPETLRGHTQAVTGVALHSDRVASVSADGTVRLWEWSTSKELHVLKGHVGRVNAVVFGGLATSFI